MWDGDYMGHPNDSLEEETKYAYFKNLDITIQCWKCGKDFQGIKETQCTGIFGLTYCEHCNAAHEYGLDVFVCEFVEKHKQKAVYSGKDAREQLADKDAEIAKYKKALELSVDEQLKRETNYSHYEMREYREAAHLKDAEIARLKRALEALWEVTYWMQNRALTQKSREYTNLWSSCTIDGLNDFINRIAEVDDDNN
jgi:hypothetical protein